MEAAVVVSDLNPCQKDYAKKKGKRESWRGKALEKAGEDVRSGVALKFTLRSVIAELSSGRFQYLQFVSVVMEFR